MPPTPIEIDRVLLDGVLTYSSTHFVDPANIELKNHLQLAEKVEFIFIVIGSEIAKCTSNTSFAVRVFARFPTGRLVTLIEHLHISVEDCEINPHVAQWCISKGEQHLELLANFISQYLGIEIERAPQESIRFMISATITQLHDGHPNITSASVTKPTQDLLGLFETSTTSA